MEHSIYEKGHPQRRENQNAVALGRITKVYADERMVEVKTFMGAGTVNDNHIPKAQWLSTDGHPDGDESGFVPRLNSYCLVFYVGGQPFVWGFMSPLSDKGTTVQDDKEKEDLYEGDRVFKTTAGNKIILRSHGEIQIESTAACRTIYFPIRNLINHLCRNYEFQTDGGTINWVDLDDELGTTYFQQEFRDDVDRTNVGIVEYGTMADESEFFYRKEIGTGSEDGSIENQVWTMTTKPDGETNLFIRVPNAQHGCDVVVLPSGETTININNKVKLKMTPDGTTTLDSDGALFKFAHSKIGMGSSSIELLNRISKELENISKFCATAVDHVHIGNLGYQSSPPVDQSPWRLLKSSTEKIKSDVDTISGGV